MGAARVGRATSHPLCEAALAYAGHGWHVFPCGPDKKPLSTNGLNDATTDAEQIERWWARWPHALIGCACGPSGFWVLDLDPPDGEASLQALIRQHGGFRETRAARTGRGGRHLYWEMSGKRVRNSAGKIGPNIDVRGDGGYVILPPSEASTGAYAWVDPYAPIVQAPTWLVTAALDANSKTRETRPNGHVGMNGFGPHGASPSDAGRYVQAAIDAECSAIVSARVGQQNQTLNDAALKIGSLLAGNPGAIRRSDARERLINAGLAMANDSSREAWTREIVAKAVDHGLEDGEANPRPKPEAQARSSGHHGSEDKKAAPPLVPRRIPADFDFTKIPRRPWVVGTRLQRGLLSVMLAPGGVGKSRVLATTALSIAAYRSLTGERLHEGGRAWLINNEDPQDELDRHTAAMCIHYGIKPDLIRDTYFANSGFDRRVLVAKRLRDGTVIQMPDVEALIGQCKENGIVYLAIDPFVSTHQVSENSNDEIEQAASQFRTIAHKANVAVELAHHVVKNASGNTEAHAGIAEHGRGAGALIAAARIVSTLAMMSEKTADDLGIDAAMRRRLIRLDCAKENQSLTDREARWFQLQSVYLPNGTSPLDPGDSVGVVEPFDMVSYADLKRSEQQAAKDEVAEPVRVSLAEFICRCIHGTEAAIKDIVPLVADHLGVSARTAGCRINEAIPEVPQWRPVEIDGKRWELARRKVDEAHPKSPRVIVKLLVRQD